MEILICHANLTCLIPLTLMVVFLAVSRHQPDHLRRYLVAVLREQS
jgi:hypothetical protein